MRFLSMIIASIFVASVARSQEAQIYVEDVFEHKVIIGVGPIVPSASGEELNYDLSIETEREIENLASYACGVFGRYAYPMHIKSDGCDFFSSLEAIPCTKYYMYACGTHQVD